MASIFRKPGSPFFFAAFRGSNGERVQRTTKLSNRTGAMKMALELEDLAAKGRTKTITEANARRVVSDILEKAIGETLHYYSVRNWFDEWLAGKRGVVVARTLDKYEQVTTDFLDHLKERADLTLAAIGLRDVRSFRDSLAKTGLSVATINQTVRKVLSAPFIAAVRLGYIVTNPCVAIEALRDDADATREVFTPEQIRDLLAKADNEWKGCILAGYFTGLRLRDVCEMEWSAIDFQESVIRIKTRKTEAKLVLPLHDELAAWLRAQTRGIGKAKVFPGLAGKGTGGRHGLSGRFRTIMESAGIKGRTIRDGKGQGRQTSSLSFHSLRHSFVSALANAGVASELRKKLSGHADDRSHAEYSHHDVETLRAAVAKLPGVAS